MFAINKHGFSSIDHRQMVFLHSTVCDSLAYCMIQELKTELIPVAGSVDGKHTPNTYIPNIVRKPFLRKQGLLVGLCYSVLLNLTLPITREQDFHLNELPIRRSSISIWDILYTDMFTLWSRGVFPSTVLTNWVDFPPMISSM